MKKSGGFSAWCYRWLPIVMGCHCRPDRSFHFRDGRPFPICARCTGMLAGFLLAFAVFPFYRTSPWLLVLMLIPGILDGVIQMRTDYVSNNPRRLWTGLLMGFGMMSLIIWSFALTMRLGWQVGRGLRKD